jgi:protein-disulfide isomerase
MRFALLSSLAFSFVLVACVDTTGLSAASSRTPKGNPVATVTVLEFADIQCPACKAAHEQVVQTLLAQYGDRIRFEFKHFPLRAIHPYAMEAAMGAECAADQNKFWEFVDFAYDNQSSLKSSVIREWGNELSLDADLFDRCIRSGIKEDTILADYDEGIKKGVQGTPTFFVAGMKVASNVTELGAAIEKAITQAAAAPL